MAEDLILILKKNRNLLVKTLPLALLIYSRDEAGKASPPSSRPDNRGDTWECHSYNRPGGRACHQDVLLASKELLLGTDAFLMKAVLFFFLSFLFFFFLRFYLFIFREGEGREGERERNMDVWGKHRLVASHTFPNLDPGPPLGHAPWLGTEPVAFPFAGWCSAHWVTGLRARKALYAVLKHCEKEAGTI